MLMLVCFEKRHFFKKRAHSTKLLQIPLLSLIIQNQYIRKFCRVCSTIFAGIIIVNKRIR